MPCIVVIVECTYAYQVLYSLHKSLLFIVPIDVTSKIPLIRLSRSVKVLISCWPPLFAQASNSVVLGSVPNTALYDFSTLK